jgi:hypothetical protein
MSPSLGAAADSDDREQHEAAASRQFPNSRQWGPFSGDGKMLSIELPLTVQNRSSRPASPI